MTKEGLRLKIANSGDCVVNYKAENSGKARYIVCTVDFNNKYIKSKGTPQEKDPNLLLVWAWDCDSFKHINPASVTKIQPLSSELRNADPYQ